MVCYIFKYHDIQASKQYIISYVLLESGIRPDIQPKSSWSHEAEPSVICKGLFSRLMCFVPLNWDGKPRGSSRNVRQGGEPGHIVSCRCFLPATWRTAQTCGNLKATVRKAAIVRKALAVRSLASIMSCLRSEIKGDTCKYLLLQFANQLKQLWVYSYSVGGCQLWVLLHPPEMTIASIHAWEGIRSLHELTRPVDGGELDIVPCCKQKQFPNAVLYKCIFGSTGLYSNTRIRIVTYYLHSTSSPLSTPYFQSNYYIQEFEMSYISIIWAAPMTAGGNCSA